MYKTFHLIVGFLFFFQCTYSSTLIECADSCRQDSTSEMKDRLPLSFSKKIKKNVKRVVRGFDKFDTLYIAPDKYNWTFMMQNSNFFQRVSMLSSRSNLFPRQKLSFSPRPSFKVGPYIGWRWLFLGYTVDLPRPFSSSKATEISFSAYANKVGADLIYIKNKGNFNFVTTLGFKGVPAKSFKGNLFDGLSMNALSLNIYYIFNHNHFSYPAVYNQSTRQKISAGSFILGGCFTRQHINFDYTKLPQYLSTSADKELGISSDFKFRVLSYRDYCISFGYAYNFVLSPQSVLSLSFTPAFGYRKDRSEKNSDKKVFNRVEESIALDGIARLGYVWNNGKVFSGINVVTHLNGYHSKNLIITNTVNNMNLYVGFYFGRKK